uniref:Uncharacterized protein n=1 Tax=Panagrolaimus sp. PS1159 TaxID=55785 RepID=A0AC35G5X6_9BILA
MAQDLYDVDEAFFKRNGRIFEVKKDSPYADEHFNFDTLAGIGLGKRSSPISRFGQARNALQNHYGKLFFRPAPSKRFLNHSDLDRALGNRVPAKMNYGKKKTIFPFLWFN